MTYGGVAPKPLLQALMQKTQFEKLSFNCLVTRIPSTCAVTCVNTNCCTGSKPPAGSRGGGGGCQTAAMVY